MISTPLLHNGIALLEVNMTAFDGISMKNWEFIVDTGATRTTIPRTVLVDVLKFTDDYIQSNKVLLTEKEKPMLANGKRADVYKFKAPRMNIGGHEIKSDYILTSDSVFSLNSLLGLDILSYFNFSFNFDAIDENSPHGRMFYEFRQSRIKPYTTLDEPYAYNLSESQE